MFYSLLNRVKFSNYFIAFILLVIFSNVSCINRNSNEPPFWDEIQNFKKADQKHFPPQGGIVFVGSSTIRMWKELEEVFKPYQAINRGFGGATLLDLYRYTEDVIFPYKPRQIIIYCGDNDIATDTVNAQMVFDRFKNVYYKIRKTMPETPLAYVSIRPSPARRKYLQIQIESNSLIKGFLSTQKDAQFINVFTVMLDKKGKPIPDLFVDDMLHLNHKGNAVMAKAIEPYLIKRQ